MDPKTFIKLAVPIVILHRNEYENIVNMIRSLVNFTNYPYTIFVVDNNSSPDTRLKLRSYLNNSNIVLIENPRNNWVLGFNEALKHPAWNNEWKYIALSDADIEVPDLGVNCWLTRMVDELEVHRCIGKLGAALRFDDIDVEDIKETIITRELIYRSRPRIGNNYIAPVDTTLALYRKDVFIHGTFSLKIGHASRIKPHYYVCRTSDDIQVRHMGWYEAHRLCARSTELTQKAVCFAIYGGYLERETIASLPTSIRLFYKLTSPIMRAFWSISLMIDIVSYLFSKFPRDFNEIQSECR